MCNLNCRPRARPPREVNWLCREGTSVDSFYIDKFGFGWFLEDFNVFLGVVCIEWFNVWVYV